jgi:hypothetical protein
MKAAVPTECCLGERARVPASLEKKQAAATAQIVAQRRIIGRRRVVERGPVTPKLKISLTENAGNRRRTEVGGGAVDARGV